MAWAVRHKQKLRILTQSRPRAVDRRFGMLRCLHLLDGLLNNRGHAEFRLRFLQTLLQPDDRRLDATEANAASGRGFGHQGARSEPLRRAALLPCHAKGAPQR